MSDTPNKPEMKGLDNDFITQLLGKSRTRNAYGPKLLLFLESDEAAINPKEVFPEFKNKNTSTVYQGFNNAMKNSDIEGVEIRQSDGEVYILNTQKVALMLAEAA